MAVWMNTPHTSWLNQPLSYWIPMGSIVNILAYIHTVVIKAMLRIGNKWVNYEPTSERVD